MIIIISKNRFQVGAMSLDRGDGAVERHTVEGTASAGDDNDESNKTEVSEHVEAVYVNMTKEEIMKSINTPFCVRIQRLFVVGFWLACFCGLCGSMVTVITTPRYVKPPALEPIQKSPVYVINVASLAGQEGKHES